MQNVFSCMLYVCCKTCQLWEEAWAAEEAIIGLPYCDVEPLITLTTEFYTTFSILAVPASAYEGNFLSQGWKVFLQGAFLGMERKPLTYSKRHVTPLLKVVIYTDGHGCVQGFWVFYGVLRYTQFASYHFKNGKRTQETVCSNILSKIS